MAQVRGQGNTPLSGVQNSKEDAQLRAIRECKLATRSFNILTEEQKTQVLAENFGVTNISTSSVTWTLESGVTATFREIRIPFADLANKTTVTFEINGRDQSLLTEATLSDLKSMVVQQYYPAIGINRNGIIDFVDGSRRRMRVILSNGIISHLTALVTDTEISSEDARELANRLQTAKEHNLWELGLIALRYKHSGLTQEQIATQMNISQSKVSRILKAGGVNIKIIRLFPDVGELSNSDYAMLSKIEKEAESKGLLDDIIELAELERDNQDPSLQKDEITLCILKSLKHNILEQVKPPLTKATVSVLASFDDKRKFARKRIKSREVYYEFNRLPKSFHEELDIFVAERLELYKKNID